MQKEFSTGSEGRRNHFRVVNEATLQNYKDPLSSEESEENFNGI
jgi:hypothetical protein